VEILSLKEISYSYQGTTSALAGVSLSIQTGEKRAVIGANGCGKSTLLQIMNGLRIPDAGTVLFDGRDVSALTLKDKSFLAAFRSRVGYVFQDAGVQLFCPTVREELVYGPRQLGLSESDVAGRAEEVMNLLQIKHLAERPPYMLSGGEKKRVAMGSVLTMNPDVLLLDEPMNGLDPRSQSFMVELLMNLSQAGKTLVIATHDLSLVEECDFQTSVLSETHELVKTGSAQDILRDTDLLIRVNLIHEHLHYHGAKAHRHVHLHSDGHRHL